MSRSQHPASAGALPDDIDTLKALVLAERDENDRLRDIIKAMQRARFGRSSEVLDPEQLRLMLGVEDQACGERRSRRRRRQRDAQETEEEAPP